MKKMFLAICAISSLCLSCKKDCKSRLITEIMLTRTPQGTDSTLMIIRYKRGSNYTNAIDTTISVISWYRDSTVAHGSVGYDFSDDSKEYKVILLPSGETHQVTNISYGHEKAHNDGKSATICSYGYELDGKAGGAASYNEDANGAPQGVIEL